MSKKNEKDQQDEQFEATGDEVVVEGDASAMTSAEELQQQLQQALEEKQKIQDQFLRTLAEMDNLRKRTLREKEDIGKFANENILRDILPAIDNLERAIDHVEKADGMEGLLEGVRMTLTQFQQVLKRFGVEVVESVGTVFDPSFHQAIGQQETHDYPANTVMMEMQKGYQLNERLLRPAFVILAKAPTTQTSGKNENDDSENNV